MCEDPQDDSTKGACTIAMTDCIFVTMSARTEEEQGRMLRTCVQKVARLEKRAMDAHGDAMRREFGGETDAQVAADRAAEKRARAKADADAAAAQAKRMKDYELAEQERETTVNRTCTTGEGMLVATEGPTRLTGTPGIMGVYVYRDNILKPVADPQAVATGQCSIQIVDGRRSFIAQVPIRAVKVYGWIAPNDPALIGRQ